MAKLLIVDDEDNIRKVLKQLLARNGFTDIIEAVDGVEALEKINDNEIDLVISDINMPRMDGIALYEKAKKLGPVFIILTAFGSIETAVNMVKSGVYDFISKPFDESELVNTVKKAVSERCSSEMEIQYSGGIEKIFFQSRHPEIEKILNDFAPLLTDDIMSGLNWQVDGPEAKEPADVARAFLLEKGLVK